MAVVAFVSDQHRLELIEAREQRSRPLWNVISRKWRQFSTWAWCRRRVSASKGAQLSTLDLTGATCAGFDYSKWCWSDCRTAAKRLRPTTYSRMLVTSPDSDVIWGWRQWRPRGHVAPSGCTTGVPLFYAATIRWHVVETQRKKEN